MFWNRSAPAHKELNPKELEILMSQGKVLVVDVREPNEYAAGHIPGSVNYPLSQFNPANVPHEAGKQTILSCAAGSRSAAALAKCAAPNLPLIPIYAVAFRPGPHQACLWSAKLNT